MSGAQGEFSDADVGLAPTPPALHLRGEREFSDDEVFGNSQAQGESAGQALLNAPGRAVRMAVQGALGVPDMLNNAAGAVLNAPFVAYDAIRGNEPGASEPFKYGAIGNAARGVADAAGLPQYDQSPLGQIVGMAGEGVAGGAGPLAVARGAAPLATGAGRVIAGAFTDAPVVDALAGGVGGATQGAVQQAGGGEALGVGANFGGAAVTSVVASTILAAVARRRAAMAPGTVRPDFPPTPDEIAAVWRDPDVQAAAQANGITDPTDPRVGLVEQRLDARRAAEADPAAAQAASLIERGPLGEGTPGDKETLLARQGALREAQTQDLRASQPGPTGERPTAPNGPMPVGLDGQVYRPGSLPELDAAREARAGYGPSNGALVPVDPQVSRMTDGDVSRARARMRGGNPNNAEPPPRLIAGEGRLPRTPEQIAMEREARQAFDLADAQRQRVVDPGIRDSQAGGALRGADDAATPRGAQDFQARSQSPGGDRIGLERQTFRAQAPDPNVEFPGAGGGRTPFPDQGEVVGRAPRPEVGIPTTERNQAATPRPPAEDVRALRKAGVPEAEIRAMSPEQRAIAAEQRRALPAPASETAPGFPGAQAGRGQSAVTELLARREGVVPSAFQHPELGDIDLAWGKPGPKGFGLAHIEELHPEVLPRLAELISGGHILPSSSKGRARLELADDRAVVALNRAGENRRWVLTAYDTSVPPVDAEARRAAAFGRAAPSARDDAIPPAPGASSAAVDARAAPESRANPPAQGNDRVSPEPSSFKENGTPPLGERGTAADDIQRQASAYWDDRAATARAEAEAARARGDTQTAEAKTREADDAVEYGRGLGGTLYANPLDPGAFRRFLGAPVAEAIKAVRDSEGYQGVQNIRRVLTASTRAGMRALGERYPDLPQIREMTDQLATDPGRGRLVRQTYQAAHEARAKSMDNRLRNVVGAKATDAEWSALRDALATGRGMDDKARRVRGLLDEQHDYLEKAGLDLGYVKGRYFPRAYDGEKILGNREAFMADAETFFRKRMGLGPEDARDAAGDWYARLAGVGDAGRGYADNPTGRFTKGRSLPAAADTDLAKWMVTDPRETLTRYFAGSSRSAEFIRRFGPNGQKAEESFRAMLDGGMRPKDVALMRTYFEAATGTMSGTKPSTLGSTLSWVQTVGTLRLLPRAVLSSGVEALGLASRTGRPLDGLKGFVDTWRSIAGSGDMKASRDAAELMGIVGDAASDAMRASMTGGLEPSSPLQQRIVTGMFRNTGLEGLTKHQRIAATRVGQAWLGQLVREVAEDSSTRRSAEYLLRDLGLDGADAKALHGWLKRGDGVLTQTDLLGDSREALLYRTAIARFVDESIQNPHAVDKPAFASMPVGRLAYGITSFMFTFARNMTLRSIHSAGEGLTGSGYTVADRARLAAPIAGLMMLGGAQWGVSELRDKLLNPAGRQERDPFVTDLMNLDRAGAWGVLSPIVNMVSSAKYDKDPGSILTGPALTTLAKDIGNMTLGLVPSGLGGANSPNTNSAEWSAARSYWQGVFAPAATAAMSLAPGGAGLRLAYGVGSVAVGSPLATRAAADSIAGPHPAPRGKVVTGSVSGRLTAGGGLTASGALVARGSLRR